MGQTLSVAKAQTSAKEGSSGKLEPSPANEDFLNKIAKFTEEFPSKNSTGADIEFKQPLVWPTELRPENFSGGDFTTADGNVESEAKGQNGPLLQLKQKGSDDFEISVSTMAYLVNVLAAAGDKKITETKLCLENNQDPVAKICGERFANVDDTSDSSTFRYFEEISKAQSKEGEAEGEESNNNEAEEKKTILQMVLTFKNFDGQLLRDYTALVSKEIRLSPGEVDRQVELIKQFSGANEERNVVQAITWCEPYTYVFNNGCRAYPKRQFYGDIGYIVAKPHEGGELYITASTNGWFINRGFDEEKKELDYEKEGDYYKDLVLLLRDKSPKFNELIDKQDYFTVQEREQQGKIDTTEDLYGAAGDEGGESARDGDGTGHAGHTSSQQHSQKGGQQTGADAKKKKDAEKKKKLEPSLKWKALGVEDTDKSEKESDSRSKRRSGGRKSKDSRSKASVTHDGDSSFEESSSESEEEEETPDRRNEANSDLPSEYWQIQKLVKYLKGGNQTATIISLCSMRDFNLAQETCQLAIRDVGGLEVLINLLDTDEIKCKIGALKILKEISRNTQIRRAIADLGGLQTMVKILRHSNKELKCLAAETIANVAKFRRARRTVRQHGGIKRLVGLLDCAPPGSTSNSDQEMDVEVARCGALALWSCSKSTRNKLAMRKAGAIPLLAKLLKSPHENMLIPVVGTLQECATEQSYRLAIRTEGMVEDLVKNLKCENQELQMHCASAIFKCAEEKETRDLVRQYGGLDPLVSLLNNGDNKELLAAATGAIWKCAISPENVVRFQELKAIDMLVTLLNDQPEEVLVNVVGALAELAKDPPNRLSIRKAGGIPPLVNLLTGTNQALLVNVTKAVGQCAEEPDNMAVIDKLDGVRLLWSLLKNQNADVQAGAAWAICPCIENAKQLHHLPVTPEKSQEAGEMVRSFVGGLELIVSLLKSDDKEVLASVCAAIANIANDEENLAVITDHGVVPHLARLTNMTDDKLRRHLAEAIARCCNWGNNRVAFGEAGAVAPLVKYLRSSDPVVHRSTARALHQLSKNPDNCITMHESGVVKPLTQMVGSNDDILQEAAAGCIANIRRLALANEKARTR